MLKKKNKTKIVATILYLLPIIFFIVSYFLITTSGEDNFQGAGSLRNGFSIDFIGDANNAFNFNSRITDMYAWPIIDFYDYQFMFGPDTILRLLDVILAVAVFYFSTYIIIGRKPKLIIKDALIFCATFICLIITPFGRPFYHEFSMVHNYVPLALATLLFTIPYLRLIANNPFKKHQILLNILMPLIGLYFGMVATITPVAFLLTLIAYYIIKRKELSRPPLWFFTGIIGAITGFLICWFVGSGVDHYTSAQAINFDYVSVSDIFSSPLVSIPKILKHEIYNFGITLLPLIAIFIICYFFSKPKIKFKNLPITTKNYILVFGLFIIIHLLGASLINAPPRILIPAYLAGIIIIIKVFVPNLKSKLLSSSIIIATAIILIMHIIFLSI